MDLAVLSSCCVRKYPQNILNDSWCARVMPIFFSYPWYADFKTAIVFKIGPILVVDVNF